MTSTLTRERIAEWLNTLPKRGVHYQVSLHDFTIFLEPYLTPSLSAGEGSEMETTAEEWARLEAIEPYRPSFLRRAKRDFDRQSAEIARLLALLAKAREEGEEAVLQFIENGSFLHDDAPPKRFAKEVVAAYRARSKP